MAKAALTTLQDQIEAIRREAFAAGYAAAMQSIRELTSRPVPGAATTTTRPRRGRRAAPTAPATPPAGPTRRRRTARAARAPQRAPRATRRAPQRDANARLIEEVLQSNA